MTHALSQGKVSDNYILQKCFLVFLRCINPSENLMKLMILFLEKSAFKTWLQRMRKISMSSYGVISCICIVKCLRKKANKCTRVS